MQHHFWDQISHAHGNGTIIEPLGGVQWLQAKEGTLAWYPGENYRKVSI